MKFTVNKTLSIEVNVLDNITIINDNIYLNKHIKKLGIDLRSLPYDDIIQLYHTHCPSLFVYDVNYKEIFSKLDLSYDETLRLNHLGFSSVDVVFNLCIKLKTDEEYYINLDKTISEKGLEFSKLHYFNGGAHTLWKVKDNGMLESAQMIFTFDYMTYNFRDGNYDLDAVLVDLKKNKESLFDEFIISSVHAVPYYNISEGCSYQLTGAFVLKDALYKEYVKLLVNKKNEYDDAAKKFKALGVFNHKRDFLRNDILASVLKIDKYKIKS